MRSLIWLMLLKLKYLSGKKKQTIKTILAEWFEMNDGFDQEMFKSIFKNAGVTKIVNYLE